jgi:glycine cleavage system H protein
VSEIYPPVAGEIVAVNESLADEPELVNQEPYGGGWMFDLRPDEYGQLDALLDAAAYDRLTDED